MTKKHYEAIAKILHQSVQYDFEGDYGLTTKVVNELADYFEQENPKFNRERFLQACGIEPK